MSNFSSENAPNMKSHFRIFEVKLLSKIGVYGHTLTKFEFITVS